MPSSPSQPICPYCLTTLESSQNKKNCTNEECKKELPTQYIQKYEEAPPLFIQIIGDTSVGKTTYLRALTLMLMRMNNVWKENYTYAALTSETRDYIRNARQFLKDGPQSNPTPSGKPNSYIINFKGENVFENHTLVISDFAGENFHGLKFKKEYTPYIKDEITTLLMISLYDLKNSEIELDDLMSSYIETIARVQLNSSDTDHKPEQSISRQAIIILSKADLIFTELPDNLQNYLKTDPMLAALKNDKLIDTEPTHHLSDYINKLEQTSNDIKKWLETKYPSAKNLIALAEENQIQLKFTITASLYTTLKPKSFKQEKQSQSQNSPDIRFEIKPRRVLDPFFWLLKLKEEKPSKPPQKKKPSENLNDSASSDEDTQYSYPNINSASKWSTHLWLTPVRNLRQPHKWDLTAGYSSSKKDALKPHLSTGGFALEGAVI